MIQHSASHVDHALTPAQLRHLLERFADRRSFFIETFRLPDELGTVPCGLYGPSVGDAPIAEAAVSYEQRGTRAWKSRLVDLPPRAQRELTVIAGPHEEPCTCESGGCPTCGGTGMLKHTCILFTAFGGPLAPQEPGDQSCKDPTASAAFWREHALAR